MQFRSYTCPLKMRKKRRNRITTSTFPFLRTRVRERERENKADFSAKHVDCVAKFAREEWISEESSRDEVLKYRCCFWCNVSVKVKCFHSGRFKEKGGLCFVDGVVGVFELDADSLFTNLVMKMFEKRILIGKLWSKLSFHELVWF